MKNFVRSLTLSLLFASTPCTAAEKLVVSGTGDGFEIFAALASAFTSENPEIRIDLPPSVHSAGGVRAVTMGDAVLGRIARPLTELEQAQEIRVVPIFRQPTVFFVHSSVNIRDLTTDQLSGIFSGTIKNWLEVGGNDLRVRVVRREDPDSSVAVFRDTLPGWKELKFDKPRSKLATTTQEAFDAVEKYQGAVGFGPYSRDLDRRFTVLSVNGMHPTDSNYPSTVTLSLIFRDATKTEAASKFIDFIFTEKAQRIVRELGAIPISRELGGASM